MSSARCNERGITIIEVVITLFLTAVGIMALLSMQPISWQTAGRSDFMGPPGLAGSVGRVCSIVTG